jgi:hypothetical protein
MFPKPKHFPSCRTQAQVEFFNTTISTLDGFPSKMAVTYAMEAVFATTELHEAILLCLDMQTLLISALRVNRKWNRVIQQSPRLQRALYFQPIAVFQADSATSERTCNPLLAKKFGPHFFNSVNETYYVREANSFYALPWTPTAAKEIEIPDLRGEINQALRYSTNPRGVAESDVQTVANERALRRHFTRRGASWRRMLVCQPPLPRLGYFSADNRSLYLGTLTPMRAVSVAMVDLESHMDTAGGLRMGFLYDQVQQRVRHHKYPLPVWFRILWGRLREPFNSDHCLDTCRDLLSKAGVVVEFQDEPWGTDGDPPNAAVLDQVFRCDEHTEISFKTKGMVAQDPQIVSYEIEAEDMEFPVF